MASLDLKTSKYLNVALPLLVVSLLIALCLFANNSVKIVSETNRNNFAYTIKVRESLEAVDVIIERSEVALKILGDTVLECYDTKRLYDRQYNLDYLDNLKYLTKATLLNSPGVSGTWVHLNTEAQNGEAYLWYTLENGKIIDYKARLKGSGNDLRPLSPQEDTYYFDPVRLKRDVWSDLYTDPDTKIKMITLSKPLFKNGILVGVVGTDLSVEALQQSLKKMQSKFKNAEIFLLDSDKHVIVSQLTDDRTPKPNDFIFLNEFKKSENKNEKMVEYMDNGVSKTAIMLDLSCNHSVVMTFPNMLIYQGFDRLFKTIYTGLTILIILAIISLMSRLKITKMNKRLKNEILLQKNIINSTPSAIIIKDKKGVILDCNEKFAETMGVPKEQLIGKTGADLFNNEMREMIERIDKTVMATKQTVIEEQSFINLQGERNFIRTYSVPLFDNNNCISGFLISSIDITRLREEQALLQKAKDAAEEAAAMKTNFLANMSHEIRTPLNGVVGFLQLLEDTDPTELQREFICDAKKSSELLLSILNEILDFSKIGAGKLEIDNISFDLHSAVEDVAIIGNSNACLKGVDVNFLIGPNVPKKVFGDPGRFKQILTNLLGNAIKFTKEGEVVIYIDLESETEETAVIEFKVKDTGIGIPEEKLKLIFESFTQGDASTTRKFGGTGLGLAIAQRLAQLMDGHIAVESKENEGSTFTLTIPFKKDKQRLGDKNSPAKTLEGKNILLVENNPTDLKIISSYLDEENCVIHEASSAEEAISIANREHHNLSIAIIDHKIQNETELSTLMKNGEHSKDIPLLLYTSFAQREDSTTAREKGFSGSLAKPITQNELSEAIKAAIEEQNYAETTPHYENINRNKFDSSTKMLVVEDCEINRKLLTKILGNLGLSCDTAENGLVAVDAFRSKAYDIILMDCEMPVMGGHEATKKIREIEKEKHPKQEIPIIALTANVLNTDREKCMEAGMTDYISKPINIKTLRTMLGGYIKIEKPEATETSGNYHEKEASETYLIEGIINEIVEELGFERAEAAEMLYLYLKELPTMIKKIEEAIESNDIESLKQTAHKLKGASANLRAETIAQLSKRIEDAANNNDKATCLKTLEEIRNCITHLQNLSPAAEYEI